MSEENEDSDSLIQALFKDLDLGDPEQIHLLRDLKQEFGELQKLSVDTLKSVGFDAAVVMGLSGDWAFSVELCRQLLARANDDRMGVKLWQLRSLVELGHFPEALALGTATRWPAEMLIHVNFLTGESFEGLRMFEEARLRFDAVFKANANYKNVAQKVTRI